jgi:AraC family transcriptional regulator, positive regulator of tynA and feaB
LDHAARLLQRRAVCSTKRPLSDIAFEAGFRDYKFFSSKFRQRFGCGPSEYAQSDQRFGADCVVNASSRLRRRLEA